MEAFCVVVSYGSPAISLRLQRDLARIHNFNDYQISSSMYIIRQNIWHWFTLTVLSIPYLLGLISESGPSVGPGVNNYARIYSGQWYARAIFHSFIFKHSQYLLEGLCHIMTVKLTKEDFKWSSGQAWRGQRRHFFLTVGISFLVV
jgi:hypothetical protein